jgi:hypothetical protein
VSPAFPRPRSSRPAATATAAVAALAFLASPAESGGQSWRTLESSRQLRDSTPVSIRVEYGAGRLEVLPTTEPVLYRMELRYDAERDEPIHEYDAAGRRLTLGARPGKYRLVRNDRGGEMRLELPRGRVPLELSLGFGAGRSEIDLRGVAVERLKLEMGASETKVRFDSTGGRPMREIDVDAGAAHVELVDIAAAAPSSVRVHVGVGGADLDFGRVWRSDIDLDVQAALGSMTLHLPRDVGVRLELDRALSGFEHDGLYKRGGNVWVSDNWDSAERRLRVRAETAFGKLRVHRF